MPPGTDWTLYIVTQTPLYELGGKLFWDDVWSFDVTTNLSVWRNVILVSPVQKLAGHRPKRALLEFPAKSIRHYRLDGDKSVLLQKMELREVLRELLGDQRGFYEFAGVWALGRYGFSIAVKYAEPKRVITFDAPIDLVKRAVYSKRSSTSRWKRLVAPFYFMYLAHFRAWAIKQALAVHVVGDGIVQELSLSEDCTRRIISAPLSHMTAEELVSAAQFEESWRAKAGRTKYTIMCADRSDPEKGVFELVKAVEERASREQGLADTVLNLYSHGSLKEDILAYVQRKGLSGFITYAGRVSRDELISAMRGCDLFVNLTKTVDFNRTMIDAAGQGCAIIASDLPGPKSFFRHGESAWLVDPTNPKEICSAIDHLLANYNDRRRIAEAALSVARAQSANRVKERIMSWYLARFAEVRSQSENRLKQ